MSDNAPRSTLYLAYAGVDAAFAQRLVADLKNAGFDLWVEEFDRETPDNTLVELQHALRQCMLMLPIISVNFQHPAINWYELEQLPQVTGTPLLPILLRNWGLPDWVYQDQTLDFSLWRNEIEYKNQLDKLITLIKVRFPEPQFETPDGETQYINTVRANIERFKAFLGTINARSGNLPRDKRAVYSQSLWGLNTEFTLPHAAQKQQVYSLHEIIENYPRFLLCGAAGTGKSTTLHRTLLDVLQAYLSDRNAFPLPILLELGGWTADVSFETFLQQSWPLPDDPESMLPQGRVMLLLDGLDELGQQADKRIESLQNWIKSAHAPRYLIMTYDGDGITIMPDDFDLPIVQIKAPEPTRIRQYIYNHMERDAAEALIEEMQPILDQSEAEIASRHHFQIVSNAFYLALTVAYAQGDTNLSSNNLPTEGQLLQWLAQTMWDKYAQNPDHVTFDEALPVLSRLAFSMIADGNLTFLPYNTAVEQGADERILQAALDAQILSMSSLAVHFTHVLLRDSLASYWLFQEEGLYTQLSHAQIDTNHQRIPTKWDRTIIFGCQTTENSDAAIRSILEVDPQLAITCLQYGVPVEENTENTLLQTIFQKMEHEGQSIDQAHVQELLHQFPGEVVASSLSEHLHQKQFTIETPNNEENVMLFKKMGAEAIQMFSDILKKERWERRRRAAWVLGNMQEPSTVPSLIEALQDDHESVRKEAIHALVKTGRPALPRLLKALHDKDPNLRAAVIHVLRRMADPDTVPDLIACLPDMAWPSNEEVKICELAALALEAIGTDEALDAVDTWRARESEWHTKFKTGEHVITQPQRDLEQLIANLDHDEWSVRKATVEALGELEDPAAVPHILKALEDEDNQVRWMAVRSLEHYQGDEVIAGLVYALHDEAHLICDAAADALSRIGEPAVASLIEALKDPDVNVRGNAAETLGKIGLESAVPHLVDLLKDQSIPTREDKRICDIAAAALERIGTSQALLAIQHWENSQKNITPDPTPEETQTVLHNQDALRNHDGTLLALDDLAASADATAVFNDPSPKRLLDFLDALDAADWPDQQRIAKQIQEYATELRSDSVAETVSQLKSALTNQDRRVRYNATEALVHLGDKDGVPALIKALDDPSWKVRIAAAQGLMDIPSPLAVDRLCQALGDKNSMVREAAAVALGRIGLNSNTVTEGLIARLTDKESYVRRAAVLALGELEATSADQALIERMQLETDVVRWPIVETLGKIKSKNAVPILKPYLYDTSKPNWEERRFCDLVADVLRQIGTDDALNAVYSWEQDDRN